MERAEADDQPTIAAVVKVVTSSVYQGFIELGSSILNADARDEVHREGGYEEC